MVENSVTKSAITDKDHVSGVEKKECVALKLLGLNILKTDVMAHLAV